jgi:hypothetical protein
MKATRLGCISGSGIIITMVALLAIGAIAAKRGGVLFNPGPLNAQSNSQLLGGVNSHAETGGRCSACHTAVWQKETMSDRCLGCHQELIVETTDFHTVMLAQSQSWTCRDCHTDHNGAQAALTVLDLNHFPHDAAGYSLRGHQMTSAGTSFTCTDCHGDQIGAMDMAVCLDCHWDIDRLYMEYHLTAFSGDCLVCHDGLDTYGKTFDHNQQTFSLMGEHASASCNQCHAGARSISDLQNTAQACSVCHASNDAHQGRFGQDCAECHTPDSWERAAFDHSLAAFQLTGAHQQVACESCHLDGAFQGTPQDCYSCHAPHDVHQGDFGQDCVQCHTPESWEDAEFDHSLAAFQLTGAHQQVACESCHLHDVFRGTPQECSGCHRDPSFHLGLFGSDCSTCHDTNAWQPALFDRSHTFPFNHGESGISDCRTCHPDSLVSYICYTCHEHSPVEIERKHREEGISNFQDCTRCHPTGREEEGEERGGDDD